MVTMSTNLRLDDGREFIGQIGRIVDTRLGVEEDRGYFVVGISLDLAVGHQEYCPILASSGAVSASHTTQIQKILDVANVTYWEQLRGEQVMALYEAPLTMSSSIAGIASLSGDRVHITADLLADTSALA